MPEISLFRGIRITMFYVTITRPIFMPNMPDIRLW